MDTLIRVVNNTADEIRLGHKLWYYPVPGCHAISATANASGFTPLSAIVRRFDWDRQLIERAVHVCNRRGEVAILANLSPNLLLVPATKGRGEARRLAQDLFRAAGAINAERLHMTHYGFLQGKFPRDEIASVLDVFLSLGPNSSLAMLVVDIDRRGQKDFYDLLRPGEWRGS
jgi:hypothetical protein